MYNPDAVGGVVAQGTARREQHPELGGGAAGRTRRAVRRFARARSTYLEEAPSRDANLRRDRVYRRALAVADAIAALISLEFAAEVTATSHVQVGVLIGLVLAAVISAKLLGLYDRDELLLRKSTLDEGPAVFQLATLFALLVSISDWQLLGGQLHSPQLLSLWVLMFGLTLVTRWWARHISHYLTEPERCLVVGDAVGVDAVSSRLRVGGGMNVTVVGRLHLDAEDDALETLEGVILREDVHRVILAPRASDSDSVLDVVRLVKGLGVKVSMLPRLFEVVGSSVVFDDVRGITVLGIRRFGLTRSSAAIKRTMDVVLAVVGLVALAPVIAAIAIAVRLDSAGPVLFRQTRVGRDGKRFSMLKFRSMVRDADALKCKLVGTSGPHNGELFKHPKDPRVTRVGRLLRSTALDELPQLFNVLRGDMSLVGPRPLVVDEDALVQGWQRRRLHLTPGMTGPWQVLGSSAPLSEMATMDYLYIANWSLFADIKIILRTALHVASPSRS